MSGRSAWNWVDGLVAVGALADDLVPALGEHVAEHLPHERGVVNNQHACHQLVPPWVIHRVRDGLRPGSTVSIRTAHSSSTSSSRPVPKQAAVDEQVDGVVRARGRARPPRPVAGRPRGRPASACGPARPTRAPAPTVTASDEMPLAGSGALAAGGRGLGGHLVERARSCARRTRSGTSCTSRQGSPSSGEADGGHVRRQLVGVGGLVRGGEELRLRRARSRPPRRARWPSRAAAAAIIWFIASPAADSSSSDSSSESVDLHRRPCPSWPRPGGWTPRRVMTKMLPPVTPSTYETLAATAGTGIDRSGDVAARDDRDVAALDRRRSSRSRAPASMAAPVDSASLMSASSVVTPPPPAGR